MADAVWFTGPRTAELKSEDIPDPGPGEVQVQAICGLVSAGSEMNLFRGEGNLPDFSAVPNVAGSLPFPVKFGYQEVGEIVAVGPGTTRAVGERVFCIHPHQSRFNLGEMWVSVIPPDLAPERAVFAGMFWVGLNSCLTTPPLVGDCVVVSGLGVIGSMTAYLARLTAGKLILVEPSAERRARAGWIGADAVVAPSETANVVEELSRGRGADLFIEASGAPPALQTALETTGNEGTISVSSWYGTRTVELSLSPEFHLRRHKVISTGPFVPPHLAPRWDMDRVREVSWQHLAQEDFPSALISHRVPFADAPRAYQLVDDPAVETQAVLLEHAT
ncbi:zinc-binding dehydrogenase [Pseudonocardia alni]|uniref:zinc-binding dehydrogenase n=1 Tax=Pseudonocardia alni TaxID=33907 RepID=UPI00280BC773|nr:zinc-binding dehydrogenase [Pseudonocardia alni]